MVSKKSKITVSKEKIANNYLHVIAMAVIVIGTIILFYLGFSWYLQDNVVMSMGMIIMGLIASANFYLHWRIMINMRK